MSKLPGDWVYTAVSKICTVVRGVTYNKMESSDEQLPGYLPVLRANNIQAGKLLFSELVYVPENCIVPGQLIKSGDVVVAMSSGSKSVVGKAAKAGSDWVGAFGAFCGVLRPSSEIEPRYFYFFTQSAEYRSRVSELSAGVSINNLKPTHFELIDMPIAPRAEQTRIAQKLDELLAQVETLKTRIDAIPALLKRFRQSILAAAVSGRLTEEWRKENNESICADELLINVGKERRLHWESEQLQKMTERSKPSTNEEWKGRYPEPVSGYFDPLELALPKALPNSWKVTNLDSATKVVTGKTPPTADPTNWEGHIPFITPSQIHKTGTILEPVRYVTAEGAKTAPTLPKGTTLIVCIGTIGKVGFLDRTGIVNQQINALIPYQGLNAQFLNIWAKTLYPWLVSTASATVNAAILNKGRLAEAPLPLPGELEQTEIVRRVEQLFAFADQLEAKVASAKIRIDHLTQSILAKAFRGELVPQDPSDEPASVLLERIQAQRAAAPKAKRGRKST